MSDRSYILMPVICLSCGFAEGTPVKAKKGRHDLHPAADFCKCPKCSNKAHVLNPLRSSRVIAAMGKEIVRLKMDIMDLQGALDDE